jgi:hypothetical protein
MAVSPAVRAQSQPQPWPSEAAPAERVLKKSTRLIRENAALTPDKNPARTEQGAASTEPGFRAADSHEGVVVLDPFIVREQRAPALPPALHEAPVRRFLRTGTIWEKVGPRFTTKFGVSGDKGIFFRLSW